MAGIPARVRRAADANAGRMILLAPILYLAHILEEAPGYIRWFNVAVSGRLPEGHFVTENLPPMLATSIIATAALSMRRGFLLLMLSWISYFMLANGLFHVEATMYLVKYCPGTVTATLLYLPYFGWFVWYLRTRLEMSLGLLVLVTMLAGAPMLIQGFMIVFLGQRFY